MNKAESEKLILGIDPGTTVTGYGLIRVTGRTPSLITLGIIDQIGRASCRERV